MSCTGNEIRDDKMKETKEPERRAGGRKDAKTCLSRNGGGFKKLEYFLLQKHILS